jgi:hypothetical protein
MFQRVIRSLAIERHFFVEGTVQVQPEATGIVQDPDQSVGQLHFLGGAMGQLGIGGVATDPLQALADLTMDQAQQFGLVPYDGLASLKILPPLPIGLMHPSGQVI